MFRQQKNTFRRLYDRLPMAVIGLKLQYIIPPLLPIQGMNFYVTTEALPA
jgi:hypothetical protein